MTNQQEQRDDLEEKLRLEGLFLPFVLEAFADEREMFGRSVRRSGLTPREDQIFEIWQPIMRRHMRNTGVVFTDTTGNDVLDNILENSVAEAMDKRAEAQSQAIANTSKRNMDKSVSMTVEAFKEDGDEFNNGILAVVAGRLLTRTQTGRDTGILVTSTQTAAETSKDIVATSTGKQFKTWVTQGDERVRPTHVLADSQRVLASKPFSVGNSLLMHPGDTSLGASLDEIINCRCSAVYE